MASRWAVGIPARAPPFTNTESGSLFGEANRSSPLPALCGACGKCSRCQASAAVWGVRCHAERATMEADTAAKYKAEGNTAFVKKDYQTAIDKYTLSLQALPTKEVLCNRAMCYGLQSQYQLSLDDANAAIELDPSWSKVHRPDRMHRE